MEPLSSWTVGISRLSATLICPRMSWRMGHVRLEPAFSNVSHRMLINLFGLHFKQHVCCMYAVCKQHVQQLLNFLFGSLPLIIFMCQWFQSCVKGIYLLFETSWHWIFMSKIKSWRKIPSILSERSLFFLSSCRKTAIHSPVRQN